MTASTDIEAIVEHVSNRVLRRSPTDAWAACATIWARLYVLVGSGWQQWPELEQTVREALSAALSLAVGIRDGSSVELVRIHLEGADIDDDGTPECQFAVDLVTSLSVALSEEPLEVSLAVAIRTYLEGVFNEIVNRRATMSGQSVSQAQATEALQYDEDWLRAVAMVHAL
jgi:hypothetical protein